MLKIIQTLVVASLPLLGAAQAPTTDHATARAGMAQGKYVFYYSQPVAAYDVVFSFSASYTPSQSMTLNTLVGAEVTGALTEAGAQLKAFDAIIVNAGARDVAIKFRDTVPAADRALATVPRNEGKLMFVYCEPVNDYQVSGTERISWYNHAFGGQYYTLGKVEENLLRTAKKTPGVEGVIVGETATYIYFKK